MPGTAIGCPVSDGPEWQEDKRPSQCGRDVDVLGYLPVDDRLEGRLTGIRDRVRRLPDFGLELGSGAIDVKWVQDEQWATAWKAFFKPLKVGRIVICPSWERYEAGEGELMVDIDPGMAFGTGNHPTTQLCLLALQDFISGGETVLDVGTGSGILAIAAARLGAWQVVGLDIDTVAVEAARGKHTPARARGHGADRTGGQRRGVRRHG